MYSICYAVSRKEEHMLDNTNNGNHNPNPSPEYLKKFLLKMRTSLITIHSIILCENGTIKPILRQSQLHSHIQDKNLLKIFTQNLHQIHALDSAQKSITGSLENFLIYWPNEYYYLLEQFLKEFFQLPYSST